MKEIKMIQKSFTNKENKVIGFVEINLITADFGAVKLEIPKESKKIVNFVAKQNGFAIGELTEKPDQREVIFK